MSLFKFLNASILMAGTAFAIENLDYAEAAEYEPTLAQVSDQDLIGVSDADGKFTIIRFYRSSSGSTRLEYRTNIHSYVVSD